MPSAGGKVFTYYDIDGEAYPFFAADREEVTARRKALQWSREHGIKLYRSKHGTSPNMRRSK
jgi:hypothetical protein